MKRTVLFSLLLVLVLAVLNLAGCGGNKENKSQPAGGQTAAKDNAQNVADDSIASLFAKGKQIEGMSYDYIVTSKDTTLNGKVWWEGSKVKTDSVMEGQHIITIVDGNTLYSYFPEENRAMKMTYDQQSQQKTKTPVDYTKDELSPDKYKIVETTVYEGVECKVIEATGADGKEQSKMWVRRDYGIPIKIESTDSSGEKSVLEYKNLKVGKQPADTFQLPAGVEVTDASEMLKNMPQMPSTQGGGQ